MLDELRLLVYVSVRFTIVGWVPYLLLPMECTIVVIMLRGFGCFCYVDLLITLLIYYGGVGLHGVYCVFV